MRYLLILLLAGCHGTELRLGSGRTNQDFDGNFASSGKHGSGTTADFDQDDSTSFWAEIAFQLQPQTIRIDDWPGAGDLRPLATTPHADPTPLLASLQALSARLDAMEEDTADHISWAQLGLSGITGAGGLGLVALALLRLRKKREA